MATSKRTKSNERNEEIHVRVFKDIHIHFPGDVYLLAVWVEMSDRAKNTPTRQLHTTLRSMQSSRRVHGAHSAWQLQPGLDGAD